MGKQVDVGNQADVEAPATPPILPILPPSTPDLNDGFSSSDEEI